MAIPNYNNPQLTIRQLLDTTDEAAVSRLHAIVVGPQYLLSRNGIEVLPTEAFDSAGLTVGYKSLIDAVETVLAASAEVDLASVRVFGTALEAQLARFLVGSTNKFYIDDVATPHILRLANVNVKGGTIDPLFYTRPVAVGDVVYSTGGASPVRRRVVTALLGKNVDGSYGANADKDDEKAGNGAGNPETHTPTAGDVTTTVPAGFTLAVTTPANFQGLVRGSKLGDRYGEEFTLTVVTGGIAGVATFSLTSASGLWAKSSIASTAPGADVFGLTDTELAGLAITIDPGAGTTVTTGQIFSFEIYGDYERLGDSNLVVSDSGSGYTGPRDTTYIVQVVTGSTTFTGAVLRITDTSGVDAVQTGVAVVADTDFNVGSHGLLLQFNNDDLPAQVGLRAGDTYFIKAVADSVSTTEFNRVVLNGPASDVSLFNDTATALDVVFALPFTGEILATDSAGGEAWVADEDGVTVEDALSHYVSTRSSGNEWVPFIDATGTLALEFRALIPPALGEGMIEISVPSDLTQFGTQSVQNDLALGASFMFSGSQGRTIYALRTAGTAVADFAAALLKVESTDVVYAMAPMTEDQDVMVAVAQHVEAMSEEDVKNFRRAYVGTDSPGTYASLILLKTDQTPYLATVSALDGANVLVQTDEDVDFTLLGLAAGDRFLLPGTDEEFEISEVLSATELVLASGPAAPISEPSAFQIWYADTPASQARFIIARNAALGSRRVANVWTENGTRTLEGTTQVIPSRFIAAEIAGLRTAVFPQQGLTNTEITAVTDAPAMYHRYSRTLLNTIAASGTFIITQDVASGDVFIRHQLTTSVNSGSLYYEDSIGVNLDNISFGVKDILSEYVGKKNVTPKTLSDIREAVANLLNEHTQSDIDVPIGAALIEWNTLSVTVHPVLKDRVVVKVNLVFPLPLNNIQVELRATATTLI